MRYPTPLLATALADGPGGYTPVELAPVTESTLGRDEEDR